MVEFGVAMIMQNAHDQLPDKESFARDLKICQLIEPLELELLVDPPAPDVVAAELTISADMPNLSP